MESDASGIARAVPINETRSIHGYIWAVRFSKGKRLLAAVPLADFLAAVVALATVITIGASIVGGTVKPETLHYLVISGVVAVVLFPVLLVLLFCKTWLEYQRRRYDPSLIWMFQKEFDALEGKRKEAAAVCFDFLQWELDEKDETKRWAKTEAGNRLAVEPVLDFFEDVGFYLTGDQFSDDVTHHNFFHWIRGWYSVLNPYIEYYQSAKGEKAAYTHVENLYRRTAEIERRYSKSLPLLLTNEAKLDFLKEEGGEGDVNVSGGLSLINNFGTRPAVVLTIRAVNTGRTPVTISRVAALVSGSSLPLPHGISEEKAAELQKLLVSSEISPTNKETVELAAHGGQHTWEMALTRRVDFTRSTKSGDALGTGYVMLTSGKKLFFDFPLLDDAAWEHISVQPGLS